MAKQGRLACPECGAGLVPTLRGMRCPRLGSCGRGGLEERGAAVRNNNRRGPGEPANA